MKKQLLLMLVTLWCSMSFAQNFTSGGINYTITRDTAPRTAAVGINASFTGVANIPTSVVRGRNTYSVTSIGDNAFNTCTGLTSVTIPISITSIGSSAFQNCTGLALVRVNWTTPISIDANVFGNVTLSNVTLEVPDGAVASYDAVAVWTNFNPITDVFVGQRFTDNGLNYTITKATVPYEVALGRHTSFVGAANIPAAASNGEFAFAVTSIGINSFYNNNNLTAITLPNSITSIGTGAFAFTKITSIAIPSSVVSIGDSAFLDTDITSIVIPNGVTRIENFTFSQCSALQYVTLPNSLQSIGIQGFFSCGIRSLNLPSTLTTIDTNAFNGCTSLNSIIFPSSITSLGDYSFNNCSALSSISVNWSTPLVINATVFSGVALSNVTLNVPEGKVAIYDGTAVWTDFNPITEQITTTWDGTSWSNGIPDATKKAIFTGNYSENVSLTALSLEVQGTAIVTVPSLFNATLTGYITVASTASLTFENNANLIQLNNNVMNIGDITIKRNSAPLKRLDYTLWSSPVSGQQLQNFSSDTLTNRFYTYNAETDKYNAATATANFAVGTGYLIRMPNNHPTVQTVWNGSFTGVPNNGTIILNNLASMKFYAVGNPYPSTISADAFLNGNATDGTLYFWRKTNATSGTAYATYTLAGATGTAAGTSGLGNPNGTIQVGQGFIVKTTANALTFTNSMRTTNNNNQFFKTKIVADKSRIWLNLTNAEGAFSQALIAYFEGATVGLDAGIDGKYIDDSKIALTSTIDELEYTIQGRPAFDASDVVSLSFKTDVAGEYTIAIDAVDGLFTAGQEVYLVDSFTGKETNLKERAYSFEAAVGENKDRFSLKYQRTLKLDAPVFNENTVIVSKKNGVITVNSSSKAIKNVQVYDVQGRLIAQQKNVNTTKASFNQLKAAAQVFIVKVIADDNTVVNKKVLN